MSMATWSTETSVHLGMQPGRTSGMEPLKEGRNGAKERINEEYIGNNLALRSALLASSMADMRASVMSKWAFSFSSSEDVSRSCDSFGRASGTVGSSEAGNRNEVSPPALPPAADIDRCFAAGEFGAEREPPPKAPAGSGSDTRTRASCADSGSTIAVAMSLLGSSDALRLWPWRRKRRKKKGGKWAIQSHDQPPTTRISYSGLATTGAVMRTVRAVRTALLRPQSKATPFTTQCPVKQTLFFFGRKGELAASGGGTEAWPATVCPFRGSSKKSSTLGAPKSAMGVMACFGLMPSDI